MYYYGHTRRRGATSGRGGIILGILLGVIGVLVLLASLGATQSNNAFDSTSPRTTTGTTSNCTYINGSRGLGGGDICTISYTVNGTTYTITNGSKFNSDPGTVTVYYEPKDPSVAKDALDYGGEGIGDFWLWALGIGLVVVGGWDIVMHRRMKTPASL